MWRREGGRRKQHAAAEAPGTRGAVLLPLADLFTEALRVAKGGVGPHTGWIPAAPQLLLSLARPLFLTRLPVLKIGFSETISRF
jgi:hypothetical protein